MGRYGATAISGAGADPAAEAPVHAGWKTLVSREYLGLTLIVGLLAVGSGLVLFGFNLWIPTNLRKLGFTEADTILRNASLMGLPLTVVVALMYGFWSSKKTIIILTSLIAAALLGFVAAGDNILGNRTLLYALLVVPIWGISSVVAVLSVYSSEIYPTRIRARGAGFAAGASKFGGVTIIALVVSGFTAPSISTVAIIGAVPMLLAVVVTLYYGVETCKRRLEDIAAEEFRAAHAGS